MFVIFYCNQNFSTQPLTFSCLTKNQKERLSTKSTNYVIFSNFFLEILASQQNLGLGMKNKGYYLLFLVSLVQSQTHSPHIE